MRKLTLTLLFLAIVAFPFASVFAASPAPNCSGLLTSNAKCAMGGNPFLQACPIVKMSPQLASLQSDPLVSVFQPPSKNPNCVNQPNSTTGVLSGIFSAITGALGNASGQILQGVFEHVFLRPFQISPSTVNPATGKGGAFAYIQDLSSIFNGMRTIFLRIAFLIAPLIFAIYGLLKMMGNENAVRDEMGSFAIRVFFAFFLAFFGQLFLVDILNVANFLTLAIVPIFTPTACTPAYPLVKGVCELYLHGAGTLFGTVLVGGIAAIAGSFAAGAGLAFLFVLLQLFLAIGLELLGFLGLGIFRVLELGVIYSTFPVIAMLLILPKTGTAIVGRIIKNFAQWAFLLPVWAIILTFSFGIAYASISTMSFPMNTIMALLAIASGFVGVLGSTTFMAALFGQTMGAGIGSAIVGMAIISGSANALRGGMGAMQQSLTKRFGGGSGSTGNGGSRGGSGSGGGSYDGGRGGDIRQTPPVQKAGLDFIPPDRPMRNTTPSDYADNTTPYTPPEPSTPTTPPTPSTPSDRISLTSNGTAPKEQ